MADDVADLTSADDPGIEGTLSEFRVAADATALTPEQRQTIVRQALALLDQAYAHLPLKKAMHAIDPVQRLRLLRYRSDKLRDRMSDRQFHDEMISVFMSLRDLHTNYILPDPYRTKTAFLPYLVEEYYEGDTPSYEVTKLLAGFKHRHFKVGVTVHHWNGVPFQRAVDINAEEQAGSNEAARHAQGLDAMTIRPLSQSLPPDEDWVVIAYRTPDGEEHQTRFDWQIFEPRRSPQGVNADAADDPAARALALNAKGESIRRSKKALFAHKAMQAERTTDASGKAKAAADESIFPDVFSFRKAPTKSGTFGYVRIWTFDVRDPNAFVGEFVRIAGLLPQNGLIIDVRGNGGGSMVACEKLLQTLTPKPIDPCRLSFINTPFTLGMAENRSDLFGEWVESIGQAVETGATYSYGFPFFPAEEYNKVGQQYTGPVVLITDALCYSATDIFSAGYQDHGIGPILGVHRNTGAGGANVFTHQLLQSFQADDGAFVPLPNNANFRVAIRRTTRVGPRSGAPLEDLGVVPEHLHPMTRRDILESNDDLIDDAGKLLAALPVRILSVVVRKKSVRVTTAGISRLDVAVDGRPLPSVDVVDGPHVIRVPPGVVDLRGYEEGQLVAARRVTVPATVSP